MLDGHKDTVEFFGLSGGGIASDFEIGGCVFISCQVSGYWQRQAVPEPGSAALLLTALVVFGFVRAPRRRQAIGSKSSSGSTSR